MSASVTALLDPAHVPGFPGGSGPVRAATLGEFIGGQPWRIELVQDRPCHTLIWLTRGQSLASINAVRRGCGAHNALFLPAGTLFSLKPGPQSFGFVLTFATGLGLGWPERPVHLRVREAAAQADLSLLAEALLAERNAARAWADEAMAARARLVSVWLRRRSGEADVPPAASPAEQLAERFAARVIARYAERPDVQEMARDLGVSATHLTRSLREVSGMSAADILDERLLHAARSLLDRPEARPGTVARSLGFPGTAAFTRFITSRTGQSPSDCKRVQASEASTA